MRILVVDDEPVVLKVFLRQLQRLGHHDVTAHGSAHDALVEIEQGLLTVDVVFCDLQMPEMDGVEFVRHLARIGYPGCLALVSGEALKILRTAEGLARAHRLRILGSLKKPVAPQHLESMLERCKVQDGRPRAARSSHVLPDACSVKDLRTAIVAGHLENHYQPQVDLATGRLVGVEALVRLRHPRHGLVFPDRFIPVAEAHGLIDDLTHVVLGHALEQMRAWMNEGLELQVAVNISMKSLYSLEFPDRIARTVAASGVPASALVLELTESELMSDARASLDILTRLRLKRFGLSIDDFGTGHSSLSKLRDLPFDELKIDRGFVDGASWDDSLRAFVDASVTMARNLDLRTVAEGVEAREDWDYLRSTGCSLAQGYFIARPMPGERLLPWLAEWEKRSPALMDR